MDCHTFRENHVAFVDGVAGGEELTAMQGHVAECPSCAGHDAMVRRALLLFRNMPPIEPSPEFADRLRARLHAVREERRGHAWLRPAGYGRPGIGIFTALAAGTIAAGFMVVSLLQTRVLTPAPALRPVVVAASPPAPVLAHAPRTTSGTIVGIGAPVLVDDTIMGADASGGPWGQLTDPAFAASVTGMPVWAAAVLAAHSPPGFPTPRLKLTNLER